MLILNLSPILKQRAIDRPTAFIKKAGISPQSTAKILSKNCRIFRLDHIEAICKKLNCTPNDLLSWLPDKDEVIPETHSLNKLKREQNIPQLQDTLKTMSLEQLNEIAMLINKQQKEKEKEQP